MRGQVRAPIFDGHNDFSEKLDTGTERIDGSRFFSRHDEGHIDLPRAKEGGFSGGLFAVFVEPPPPAGVESTSSAMRPNLSPVECKRARSVTLKRLGFLKELEKLDPSAITVAQSVADIQAAMKRGALAMVLHLEGAEAVEPGLGNLEAYYALGLRSIGIVWSRENAFGFGVPFRFPGSPDSGPGLKDAGKALVRACNDRGILVDLSHLNEKGFWDVAALSSKPLVASHSCVHALCPSPRNLTDRQLDAIGESDGIVGINFSVMFLRPDGEKNVDTPLSTIAKHFRYIADRIGVDHVGMGSDFDGTVIPAALGDVAGLPRLLAELEAQGFGDDELEKIAYKNWLRVLAATW